MYKFFCAESSPNQSGYVCSIMYNVFSADICPNQSGYARSVRCSSSSCVKYLILAGDKILKLSADLFLNHSGDVCSIMYSFFSADISPNQSGYLRSVRWSSCSCIRYLVLSGDEILKLQLTRSESQKTVWMYDRDWVVHVVGEEVNVVDQYE